MTKITSTNTKKSVGRKIPIKLFPRLSEAAPEPLIKLKVIKSENSR